MVNEIYIPLLNEGTWVARPTLGEAISELMFRVLPTEDYNLEDENWMFPPGSIVRCERQFRDGRELLIAVEKVQ